ncbi:MAG: hypothetical protein FWF92_07480 [Oscillospiraceae bacterium]|nr:hypothetical protein [Oscillospiraceae bacterium]
MNTKNTKTAVIILLIIANIFFIYNIINLKIQSENIPSEMIDDAVNILEKNGFIADRSKIPAKKPSSVIYEGVYEGVYSQNTFADIVKYFSGISDEELKDIDYMQVPVGRSCTAGDYRFTVSNANYFNISIIEKSYIVPEMDFDELDRDTETKKEILSESGITGIQNSDIKKAEKIIKNFIKKYNTQDIKLGFVITGFSENKQKNCDTVLINQSIDGAPIDSHTVYIEIQDGRVKYFSGKWYFGEFIGKYPMPLLDSVNILFKSIEIDGNIIQESGKLAEMSPEYTVMRHDTDKFYLLPSWQIKFDGGRKFSYNMITGNKN